MTILLHKPYLVKVTTKGEGGSKIPKILTTWFMNDSLCDMLIDDVVLWVNDNIRFAISTIEIEITIFYLVPLDWNVVIRYNKTCFHSPRLLKVPPPISISFVQNHYCQLWFLNSTERKKTALSGRTITDERRRDFNAVLVKRTVSYLQNAFSFEISRAPLRLFYPYRFILNYNTVCSRRILRTLWESGFSWNTLYL